jgi:hypothetical protein
LRASGDLARGARRIVDTGARTVIVALCTPRPSAADAPG